MDQTSQQKSTLPPPGFLPARITRPGGIEGRGVISHTRASGVISSQCAALRRATGKIIATLRLTLERVPGELRRLIERGIADDVVVHVAMRRGNPAVLNPSRDRPVPDHSRASRLSMH